jgi:hypothetical protein
MDESGRQKISPHIIKQISKAAARPQTGYGLLDDRLTPIPAGGL